MAAMELTSSLSEILSSLDTSKIPDKLHCPVCDKFLLNGYKSSCCDQAICENCYGEVSDHCPMCEHRPFSQDLCKPYKAIRNTAKAFLKTYEKKLADERAKAVVAAENTSIPTPSETEDANTAIISPDGDVEDDAKMNESAQEQAVEKPSQLPAEDQAQQSVEATDELEVDDDAVNLITEEVNPAVDTSTPVPPPSMEPTTKAEVAQDEQDKEDGSEMSQMSQMQHMQNMMSMNPMFSGMDMNQMNQMMAQMMAGNSMNGFNPMMAMQSMAMNPMLAGFGGPGAGMNGMNGMNMGMNFPQNQGMYGVGWNSQNNNMWNGPQNNNLSDFGPNAGYGYNQHGNFNQHQYNGDFQNGSYGRGFGRGRGRGRGRGGFDRFDRGRGNFNNFSQGQQPHFQNAHEQQQYEIQNMQASMMDEPRRQSQAAVNKGVNGHVQEDEASKQADDEFAPGGQEEVQEALGGDYNNVAGETTLTVVKLSPEPEISNASAQDSSSAVNVESNAEPLPAEVIDLQISQPAHGGAAQEAEAVAPITSKQQQIAEIYSEDSQASMPPPSAPLGPAARFSEPVKDFGFRGRGHGRFGSKGRGPVPLPNGLPLSPAKTTSRSPVSPKEPKTVGVVGAPTGPKAMREPPPKATTAAPARGNSGGFQIMGRATMASQKSQSLISDRSRSGTPTNLYNGRRSPSPSSFHRPSQQSHHTGSRDDDGDADRDRDRERRHRKSRREQEDLETQDTQSYDRASSPGESRRSRSHREKDRHTSGSKHHSSRSRRHEDEAGDADHDMDGYGISSTSNRDEREHRSNTKSNRHESRRERHRDGDRDQGRDERPRDRKRSRHDRDEDEPPGEDDDERRRSRKHKSHHESNGRSSHRSSEVAAPAAAADAPPIDPHTLEREARNKERMLKEQQRREKASKVEKSGSRRAGGGGSGRRVSYKYEDEVQAGLGEQERESARWR